jgi:hypothetical protein
MCNNLYNIFLYKLLNFKIEIYLKYYLKVSLVNISNER